MNSKFHAAVHQRDEVTYVKLGGVIDEDNELGDLTDRIPAGTVVIDLAEIERINSCGVRDWVNWLTKLEKSTAGGGATRVVLVECSPAIVSQINLVNNFTGTGVVKSFYAPYYCPNCDREKVLLIESAEMGPPPHRAPTCRCDECDGVMDFDDMEDSYFAFLGSARKVTDSAKDRITQVVSEFNAGDHEKSKIRSRVGSSSALSSAGGALGMGASSLPSVPSLPSMARSSGAMAAQAVQPSTGPFTAASALSLPGVTASGSGNRTFSGGGSGGGGSRPGAAALDLRAPMLDPASRFGASITAPRSSRMVYVLVAVLIAAICVLAVLLFSGESPRRTGVGTTPSPSAVSSTR